MGATSLGEGHLCLKLPWPLFLGTSVPPTSLRNRPQDSRRPRWPPRNPPPGSLPPPAASLTGLLNPKCIKEAAKLSLWGAFETSLRSLCMSSVWFK